jgi:hypothetical protein
MIFQLVSLIFAAWQAPLKKTAQRPPLTQRPLHGSGKKPFSNAK